LLVVCVLFCVLFFTAPRSIKQPVNLLVPQREPLLDFLVYLAQPFILRFVPAF
jgi:hypothetical protein